MSTINDGGPAFPVPTPDSTDGRAYDGGMSLRAYFAGQALAGYCAHQSLYDLEHIVISRSLSMADALIAELNKPTGGAK